MASAYDTQTSVRPPIASSIMDQRVMPTRSLREPTLPQFLETNLGLFYMDLPEYMIVLK
jgi:hypothetical protein